MNRSPLPVGKTCILALMILPSSVNPGTPAAAAPPDKLRFEVVYPAARAGDSEPPARKLSGRLMVVLGPAGSHDPRFTVGETGRFQPPVLGRDVVDWAPGEPAVLDAKSAISPIRSLSDLKPGRYAAQALLHRNRDLNFRNAPGDLYSSIVDVQIDEAADRTVRLELSRGVPDEKLPADSDLVNYLKIRSDLLSEFHGRPIYLRAGVILPRDFAAEPGRRYPLLVHIGGYASRYSDVAGMMHAGSSFRADWMADDTPRMILVHLDGAGPLGDPYQVDSANHGPYGAAVTRELLPYVEKHFRALGEPRARFLDGGSTGGWVALALQVFYPDYFNGAWSFCPDSVDFRSFELVNIYEDENAYVNQHGFERPACAM